MKLNKFGIKFLIESLKKKYSYNFKFKGVNMIGILQLLVGVLILVSFAMVVAVPVILATPGEWEKSQSIVWSGAGLWSALVIITGIFNVVPA